MTKCLCLYYNYYNKKDYFLNKGDIFFLRKSGIKRLYRCGKKVKRSGQRKQLSEQKDKQNQDA